MRKRVHHAWFTILEEDDETPLRIEDLRSNIENVLAHSATEIQFHLEDVECKDSVCAACPHRHS